MSLTDHMSCDSCVNVYVMVWRPAVIDGLCHVAEVSVPML